MHRLTLWDQCASKPPSLMENYWMYTWMICGQQWSKVVMYRLPKRGKPTAGDSLGTGFLEGTLVYEAIGRIGNPINDCEAKSILPNGGAIYTIDYNSTIRKKDSPKKQTKDPNKKKKTSICHFLNGGKPKLPNCCFPQLQLLSLVGSNQVSTRIFDANLLETCTRWASACRGPPDSELEGPGRRNKFFSHEKNPQILFAWFIGTLTMAYNIP